MTVKIEIEVAELLAFLRGAMPKTVVGSGVFTDRDKLMSESLDLAWQEKYRVLQLAHKKENAQLANEMQIYGDRLIEVHPDMRPEELLKKLVAWMMGERL